MGKITTLNRRIYLIDYNCVVDNNLMPIGHTLGLAKKLYGVLVQQGYEVVNVCSPEYANKFSDERVMPILTCVCKGQTSIKQEKEIIKKNFDVINKNIKNGVLFFIHINTQIAYLMPKQNKRRKNICICFSNIRKIKETDGLVKSTLRKLYFIFHNLYLKNRAYVIIKTNKQLQFYNNNVLYMPDYYYVEKEYARFKCEKQSNKIVCLGQNNEYKKIVPLITKLMNSKYQLVIRGKFLNEEVYQEALRLSESCNNIIIENNNISYDVYYRELASSKYCVLPYDTDFYYERTTGIGIEAMFLNSIVIGPRDVLEFNDIKGIKYDSIENLDLNLLEEDSDSILKNYESKRQNEFSEIKAIQTINEAIKIAMSKIIKK